ncbi:ATP-binding cassette sub-family G member 4 [Condylostylus longicornis]|uniref:ATP-binding cassette sub-family G member 4 n=1 Tax=Condylostylus longicornis TaxID=2530218 RepID=UPI00244DE91B|nr:ATP-binding cassette sub-family G member 4 [Condylostylus longicornis]
MTSNVTSSDVKSRNNSELKNNNYIKNKKMQQKQKNPNNSELKHLPEWPPINIDFNDLYYTVPSSFEKGNKTIINNVSGQFRSNELTAILGPSGCGKTTLLNLLAEYKTKPNSGEININGKPRQTKIFRKMSRFIMQHEELDEFVTVREAMMLSANLKLGSKLSIEEKNRIIDEILVNLRLSKAENTLGTRLSGGEKKRLSIAMELVDNPPVIFLDEPTTGLDDLSSSQCITLLRRIAHAGRTVICSIHTPSAKIFQSFDNIYVLSQGQCIYQGLSSNVLPYLENIGLPCPRTYNPADFIIEVSCGEYGFDHIDKMITIVQNGKLRWSPNSSANEIHDQYKNLEKFEMEINQSSLSSQSGWWEQFFILLQRMLVRMWRDKSYMKLKFGMQLTLGLLLGCLYEGSGTDATKALFNYGLAFAIMISFVYLPMMPVLAAFPAEFHLLKREHFNQWYKLGPYYLALIVARIPFMLLIATIYLTIIYVMSSQPLELWRFGKMFSVAILTGLVSDSYGYVIGSRFNMVNGQFIGPASVAPMIILAGYGFGFGIKEVPFYITILMNTSYLRHSILGIMAALYENRPDSICPDEETICLFRKSKTLLKIIGLEEAYYLTSIYALICFYIVFTVTAYWLIKTRLNSSSKKNQIVQYVEQFLKKYFNFTSNRY